MKNFKIINLILFVSLFFGCANSSKDNVFYYVRSVVDGDTIILSNNKHLRYIGINSPELREKINNKWVYNPSPYAVDALNLNKELVEGKKVKLEFDKEITDRYGRWLAYVFINDKMVNEELLRNGYATVYIHRPNTRYLDRLKAAEQEAKENKRGIWSGQKKY